MNASLIRQWFAACEIDNPREVASLLERDPGLLPLCDGHGENGLHKAAFRGAVETLKLLLEAGIAPAALNCDGQSALHLAARGNAAVAVPLLHRAGIPVDLADAAGRTALMLAASAQALEALLAAGAAVGKTDLEGRTALHHAVLRLSCAGARPVRTLLQVKANPGVPDRAGDTPLHLDVSGGATWLLVGAGARINALNHAGASALELAIRRGQLEAVRCLINAGASPGAGNIRDALEEIAPVPAAVVQGIRDAVEPNIVKLRKKPVREESASSDPEVIRLLPPGRTARRNPRKGNKK